jgi:hypothetical protein
VNEAQKEKAQAENPEFILRSHKNRRLVRRSNRGVVNIAAANKAQRVNSPARI